MQEKTKTSSQIQKIQIGSDPSPLAHVIEINAPPAQKILLIIMFFQIKEPERTP